MSGSSTPKDDDHKVLSTLEIDSMMEQQEEVVQENPMMQMGTNMPIDDQVDQKADGFEEKNPSAEFDKGSHEEECGLRPRGMKMTTEGLREVDALSRTQIDLKTSTKAQDKAVNVLCICVLFDMLGGFLLQPVFAKMCSNAEGYNGPKIDNAFGDPGIKFSISIAMFAAINALGMALSNIIFPPLSDKIGRKPVIVLFQFCSIIGHVGSFAVNMTLENYWAFAFFNFWMGLFGGTLIIAITYLRDMFPDPADKGLINTHQNKLMGAASVAVSLGSLLGLGVSKATGELYYASILGACLSTTGFIMSLGLPGQLKSLKEIKAAMAEKEEDVPTPKVARNIILSIMIAMFLDTIGSTGLNTIRQNGPVLYGEQFMDISDTVAATQVFAIVAGVPICTWIATSWPGKGPVHACVIGNVMTGLFQLLNLPAVDTTTDDQMADIANGGNGHTQTFSMTTFLVLLYASAVTNVFSQMQNDTLVMSAAPAEKRGYWGGRARLVQNLCNAVGPLVWAVLTEDGIGTFKRMLIICSSVSFLAALGYLPQYVYFPVERKEEGYTYTDIESFTNEPFEEWNQRDFIQRSLINSNRLRGNLEFYKKGWTSYEQDIKSNTHTDEKYKIVWDDPKYTANVCEYFKGEQIKLLSSTEQMQVYVDRIPEIEASYVPDELLQGQNDLGQWVANYLDDSGYHKVWYAQPEVFKMMMANSFPRLLQKKMETVNDVETWGLDLLKVMNKHCEISDARVSNAQKEQCLSAFDTLRSRA